MSRLGPQHFGGPLHTVHEHRRKLWQAIEFEMRFEGWLALCATLLAHAEWSVDQNLALWQHWFARGFTPEQAVAAFWAAIDTPEGV